VLQSAVGKSLVDAHRDQLTDIDIDNLDSFLLLEDGKAYIKSEAWFRLMASLQSDWRVLRHLSVLPRSISDFFYDQVGKRRYRWFGQREVCLVPDDSIRERFLDGSF
jgi:predicted DCC family thiol-disulfide oxidoreductase YuxK